MPPQLRVSVGRGRRWTRTFAPLLAFAIAGLAHIPVALGDAAHALPHAVTATTLPAVATPVQAPVVPTPTALADEETPAANLPGATVPLIDWPNPSSPPAWIQWLGWSADGHRIAWRQGPEWAQMLPGTPIEIVRLDDRGKAVTQLHQRAAPSAALKERQIRSTEPLFVERKTDRDVLLRTSNGRTFAVVVRPGRVAVAAVLEKNRRSYDPIARWLVRGPADRVDVMAFEDLRHRLLALVVHTDSGPLRQAQVAVLPLNRALPVEVTALTLPEAVTETDRHRPLR